MSESGRAAIDRMRDDDGGLGREAVRSLLPYGEDFLFVDRASSLDERAVVAHYTVPADTPWIRAHFPGFPLMPGALVAEGLGQAGTLVLRYRLASVEGKDLIGLEIERARFLEPARPGDVLTYRVEVTAQGSRAARLEGVASIGDRRIGTARFVVGILQREVFEKKLGSPDAG